MQPVLISATILNFFIGSAIFRIFFKRRYLFSDRFGYTLTSIASAITSLSLGVSIYLLNPENIVIQGIVLICSVGIGILFGLMVNTQTVIAGVFNGGVGGIMGVMLGAVGLNPALCGLPMTIFTEQAMVLFFTFIGLVLHLVTAGLLFLALKS
ncbi:hypothetical protein A8F94_01080 [Bacillus sp. FJAT-27225]|uniref:hypothetical protein n=1 Tax=Bacillus sp. FJAT-27225 TaxID=1743144 RepID=UPI00080C2CA0|nr:hypothetical protein [Bacillus sp. FJAT-27225]OCA90510.1 hypothetical protein A8F94_01080 [Bacillus sp. FJAT-27225]